MDANAKVYSVKQSKSANKIRFKMANKGVTSSSIYLRFERDEDGRAICNQPDCGQNLMVRRNKTTKKDAENLKIFCFYFF